MSFCNENRVKAVRKRHVCVACNTFIELGSAAINWVGIFDGEFSSVYYHPECREAEVHLNKMRETGFYDDWSSLDEAEKEDYPDLRILFPLAYLRLVARRDTVGKAIAQTANKKRFHSA